MPRFLVISFARSGKTHKVAEEIAGRLQADREDSVPHPRGVGRTVRAQGHEHPVRPGACRLSPR